jgi:hypothetical protein
MSLINRAYFLFLIALLAAGTTCLAQDDELFGMEPQPFEGRFIIGANITQVDGDSYSGFHKVGLNVGGMVYVHFSPSVGVSMEMLYAQKGARGVNVRESPYVGTYFDKYYLNLNYVEVPLLFHLKRLVFFDFEAGVSYARLIKSKEWGEADVPVQIFPEFNYFNPQDICYVGGASMRLSKHWYGNIRLQYSVVSIRPSERVPPRYNIYNQGQFNNVVSFRMMYRL